MPDKVRRDRFPGLFPDPPAEPTPEPAVTVKPGHCFCCGHSPKKHCKSGERHGRWRVPVGTQAPAHTMFTCTTRHCEEPLCSCTSFAATADDVVYPNRPLGTKWSAADHERWNGKPHADRAA